MTSFRTLLAVVFLGAKIIFFGKNCLFLSLATRPTIGRREFAWEYANRSCYKQDTGLHAEVIVGLRMYY